MTAGRPRLSHGSIQPGFFPAIEIGRNAGVVFSRARMGRQRCEMICAGEFGNGTGHKGVPAMPRISWTSRGNGGGNWARLADRSGPRFLGMSQVLNSGPSIPAARRSRQYCVSGSQYVHGIEY